MPSDDLARKMAAAFIDAENNSKDASTLDCMRAAIEAVEVARSESNIDASKAIAAIDKATMRLTGYGENNTSYLQDARKFIASLIKLDAVISKLKSEDLVQEIEDIIYEYWLDSNMGSIKARGAARAIINTIKGNNNEQ